MRVVFWNVQRIGNVDPKSEEAASRLGYFLQTIAEIVKNGADLIILCEVSQKGQGLADEIESSFGGWHAQYVPVNCPRAPGVISPCGFLVAANRARFAVTPKGVSSRRPAIEVGIGGELISACHIIATGGEPSREEILEFLDDMHSGGYLIGDMNFRIEKWGIGENQKELLARKVQVVALNPAQYTFQNKRGRTKLIDYLIAPADSVVSAYQAVNAHDFDLIDHLPVGYIL